MLSHEDFKPDEKSNFTNNIIPKDAFHVKEEEPLQEFKEPRFKFQISSRKRIILTLDLSQSMNHAGKWQQTRNALFRFFSHVPEGTEVGIVTFGGKRARTNMEPTVVTKSNRHGLFGKIPFRLLNDRDGCVACGLEIAGRLLTLTNELEFSSGSIVLITATEVPVNSMREVKKMVYSQALPIYRVGFKTQCDEVSELTKYGANYVVHPRQKKLLQRLSDIFLSIINRVASSESRLIRKSFERDFIWQNDQVIEGNFVIEESLNMNMWMILTSPFKEDVELFEVISPSGVLSELPQYEHGLVYFHMPGMNEIGIWTFRAKLFPTVKSGVPLTIEVVSEATGSASVELSTWTNVDSTGVDAMKDQVIVYASVSQSSLPIRNAKVVAHVQKPGSFDSVALTLRDDGTGYPDVTKGDGIYSAYFMDFAAEPGLYSISVTATHNNGEAMIPKPTKKSNNINMVEDCCGSAMAENLYSIPTKSFEQHVSGPAFKVRKGIQFFLRDGQPRANDIFPPSRVTDLSVMSYVNQSLYVTVSWSAPGGNLDQGKAFKYEIGLYTNQQTLLDSQHFQNRSIQVHESLLPKPSEFGSEQTATFLLPTANTVYYCALVAVDESGNRSPSSNLIALFAKEVTTTPSPDLLSANEGSSEASAVNSRTHSSLGDLLSSLGQNIYIIVAVVISLILIIGIIVVVKIIRMKKREAFKAKQKQRTQIFVNDIEPPNVGPHHAHNDNMTDIPDLTTEKSIPYGGVWTSGDTTQGSTGGNHSPSSDFSNEFNLYRGNGSSNGGHAFSLSDQASWAYMAANQPGLTGQGQKPAASTAPVHDFRPPSTEDVPDGVTPTYQNWNCKPPSDNGTATTSSTECSTYESDQLSEKLQQQQQAATMIVAAMPRNNNGSVSSYDPCSLSLSPSFISEKRRRQESLV